MERKLEAELGSYAAKNEEGKKVGSSEDKLFNESSFSENLKEQQTDKNPLTLQLFNHSTKNNPTLTLPIKGREHATSTLQPFNLSTDISLPSYPPTLQPSNDTVLSPYRPIALSPDNLHISIITAIMALFLTLTPAFAEDLPMSALVTPTNVDFKICTRNYIMPEEKLFYMAIVSARANNFEVNEIQSKTGYILFTAAGKQYLASVLKVDNKNSMLKITPVNNNYFFAPGIVLNFFKYIDLNGATPIVELSKG